MELSKKLHPTPKEIMKRFLYATAFASILISCNNSSLKSDKITEEVAYADAATADNMVAEQKSLVGSVIMSGNNTPIQDDEINKNVVQENQNKIIRKGSLSIESKDVNKTKEKLNNFIQKRLVKSKNKQND